jgi:hypothetical protein
MDTLKVYLTAAVLEDDEVEALVGTMVCGKVDSMACKSVIS